MLKGKIFNMAIRMFADVTMATLTLAAILSGRFIWLTTFNNADVGTINDAWNRFFTNFLEYAPVLSILLVSYFFSFGLYSYARGYTVKHKLIAIFQAVSLTYLTLALLAYLLPFSGYLPRSVMLLSWVLNLLILGITRVWSAIWKQIAVDEMARVDQFSVESKNNSVLLIGGAGYIGSALLPKLLDAGYHVRLLDLFMFGEGPIADSRGHENLEILKADFRHLDRMSEAIKGMDVVVHLGGIVGDPACSLDEDLTLEVNLVANRMIAELARGYGVSRLIFASSCSVYGHGKEILDENSALNPVSLYARTKIGCERIISNLCKSGHMESVILRFGTIYGFSGRIRFDLVVNLLTAKAITEGKITVFNGDQWRPFVHVDDAALSIMKALEAPSGVVANQVFNVGSDAENYRIRDVGEIIQREVESAQLIETETDGDRRDYKVSFEKIARELRFQPKWTVEAGARQIIDAFERGAVTDYTDPLYSNYKFLCGAGANSLIRENGHWIEEALGIHYDPRKTGAHPSGVYLVK